MILDDVLGAIMSTALEEKEQDQIPHRIATCRVDNGSWARASATVGAAAWALLAAAARAGLARIGAIELMLLFAPLIVVPLGMELGRLLVRNSRLLPENPRQELSAYIERITRRAQPLGAACAVVAIMLPPGLAAGVLACGWLAVCLLAGGTGVMDAITSLSDAGGSARSTLFDLALIVARLDLLVGGSWLVASRLGMRPMGIQEPIGLLTAVHFHFAGFATAMIAAAMLRFARASHQAWLKWIVPLVIGMPYVVAIGFVISPGLKMIAAAVFSSSVAALAVLLRSYARRVEDREARLLLQIAAGAVFAGMVLSSTYAVADFVGSDVLTIPQMARTHGIFNALGFCMAGLLGWVIEYDAA